MRAGVRALCKEYPDTYWRELDAQRAYPEAFVKALTAAGYLAALIPEEFGGSGLGVTEASIILEEINRSGGNSGACHAQMYTMGTLLRHGSDAQKREYLPKIAAGELRLQAFGVSEPTTGSDTTQLKTTAVRKGDQLRDPRAEDLDLARRALGSPAADRADHADRRGQEAERRPVGPARGHATGGRARPDHPSDPHDDESRDDGAVLRRSRGAGRHAGRRGREGLPVSDRRPERRADPDRRRVRRRRPLVHRSRDEVCEGARRVRPADRPEPGRAVSDRAGARQRRGGRPDAHPGGGAVRSRGAVRRRGQHGQAARGRRVVGGGQRRRPDLRRLRLRRGLRHRAQVPRDQALPGGADLDQPDPRLRGRARARPAEIRIDWPSTAGHHRRFDRAGGVGAVRDAPARRSRRARDQDRAAGRRRLRAELRPHRRRACRATSSGSIDRRNR